MKIWTGYGSEHSSKLVLIGRFETESSAEAAIERMEQLQQVSEGLASDDSWDSPERYPQGLYEALRALEIWDLGHSDVDIFRFEYGATRSGKEVRVETDESEIQGFVKVLLAFGGKIEIFSAHEWNSDGTPRDDESDDAPTSSAG